MNRLTVLADLGSIESQQEHVHIFKLQLIPIRIRRAEVHQGQIKFLTGSHFNRRWHWGGQNRFAVDRQGQLGRILLTGSVFNSVAVHLGLIGSRGRIAPIGYDANTVVHDRCRTIARYSLNRNQGQTRPGIIRQDIKALGLADNHETRITRREIARCGIWVRTGIRVRIGIGIGIAACLNRELNLGLICQAERILNAIREPIVSVYSRRRDPNLPTIILKLHA